VKEAVSQGGGLGQFGDAGVCGRVWGCFGEALRCLEGGRWVLGDSLGGWGRMRSGMRWGMGDRKWSSLGWLRQMGQSMRA